MLKKRFPFALAAVMLLTLSILAQSPPQSQKSPDDETVVRISTDLIQVDVIVTDDKGRQITDLRPEEFEIFEDNRPQQITNFSYISAQPTNAPAITGESTTRAGKGKLPLPPARLRPEQVRRTLILVIDDLGLSVESVHYVREAMKKFVNEQMQPGDLVSIVRTGNRAGMIQQLTNDKRQLHGAIERIKWYPFSRGGAGVIQAVADEPVAGERKSTKDKSVSNPAVDNTRQELSEIGTLNMLKFIVQGLERLPGRKAMVLFSEGFRVSGNLERQTENGNLRTSDQVNGNLVALTDQANRASTVIYTIDTRTLQTLNLAAEDELRDKMSGRPIIGSDGNGVTRARILAETKKRNQTFSEQQNGMAFLARQTGGIFTTDIDNGVQKVLNDQSGYYLIGYVPAETTFNTGSKTRNFHELKVKVKRTGLKVRSRKGFYGISDEEVKPEKLNPGERMISMLNSPFSNGDLHPRLTPLFAHNSRDGSYISCLLHIDANELSFQDEADDWHKTTIDLIVLTYGNSGNLVDQISKTHSIRVRGEVYQQLLREGLVICKDIPVKDPGAYQVRVAVRDTNSDRIGADNQPVEIPDLKRGYLALSGLYLTGSAPTIKPTALENDKDNSIDPLLAAGTRTFIRGSALNYTFSTFNARFDKQTQQPKLKLLVRLFRDEEIIFNGNPVEIGANSPVNALELSSTGRLQLGSKLAVGEYQLQVIVIDELADEAHRIASQAIDLRIVEK